MVHPDYVCQAPWTILACPLNTREYPRKIQNNLTRPHASQRPAKLLSYVSKLRCEGSKAMQKFRSFFAGAFNQVAQCLAQSPVRFPTCWSSKRLSWERHAVHGNHSIPILAGLPLNQRLSTISLQAEVFAMYRSLFLSNAQCSLEEDGRLAACKAAATCSEAVSFFKNKGLYWMKPGTGSSAFRER